MSQTISVNNFAMKAYIDSSAAWLGNYVANDSIPYEHLKEVEKNLKDSLDAIQSDISNNILAGSTDDFKSIQDIVEYFRTTDTNLDSTIQTKLYDKYLGNADKGVVGLLPEAQLELSGNIYNLDVSLRSQIEASFNALVADIADHESSTTDDLNIFNNNFLSNWDITTTSVYNQGGADYVVLPSNKGGDGSLAGLSDVYDSLDSATQTQTANKVYKIYQISDNKYVTVEEDSQHNLMYCLRDSADGSNGKVILQMQLEDNAGPAFVSKM